MVCIDVSTIITSVDGSKYLLYVLIGICIDRYMYWCLIDQYFSYSMIWIGWKSIYSYVQTMTLFCMITLYITINTRSLHIQNRRENSFTTPLLGLYPQWVLLPVVNGILLYDIVLLLTMKYAKHKRVNVTYWTQTRKNSLALYNFAMLSELS